MKTVLLFLMMFSILETSNCQMLEVKRGSYLLREKLDHYKMKDDNKLTDEQLSDKIEKDKEAKDTLNKDITMKGLGNFTFNGRKVIPNIQILADRVSRSNSNSTARWYSKIELFAQPDITSLDRTDYKINFFIPEFSTYGINYTFAGCNVKYKDYDYDKPFVGFIFSTSFLDKSFKKEYDSLSIKKIFLQSIPS